MKANAVHVQGVPRTPSIPVCPSTSSRAAYPRSFLAIVPTPVLSGEAFTLPPLKSLCVSWECTTINMDTRTWARPWGWMEAQGTPSPASPECCLPLSLLGPLIEGRN